MTISYRVRGVEQSTAISPPTGQDITVTSQRRLLPGSARETGVGEVEVKGDEVVRVELENGFVLWTRADDLLRERGRKQASRDGGEAWEIDLRPRVRGTQAGQRGWLGLGIKVLELFGVDLSGMAAAGLGKKLEERQLNSDGPGLYRCPLDDDLAMTPVPETETLSEQSGPLLVFIHGTGSSSQGSFGKLWEGKAGAAARKVLRELYGDRVHAWEHRSLTESPIQNALALVRRLPAGAEVHLVTHSRGGLVGELLCLGERDPSQDPLEPGFAEELFAADRTMAEQIGLNPLDGDAKEERNKAYKADRDRLGQLIRELDERKLKIRRFVRVACPARGTTLASGRLDRWLSVLDYLTGSGLVGDAADFLLAVVKERTDPRTLPGLEAMMPGSALTRLLQHPALRTGSDLTVIAGDIEGDSLWGQLKLLATDWFYGADHDLVVNTGSMYGGIRRSEAGARFLRDQGPDVSHFNYFANPESLRWLVAGLTRADGSDGGFQPIQAAKHEEPRWREAVRRSRASAAPRPLAVVLPGTMGSALEVQGQDVWVSYWALMRGGLKRLSIGAEGVEPTDLLDDFYGPLLEFLARSHRVEIFPYDWRLSVRDTAVALADRLEAWLPAAERSEQPVHLVAHSMGGLVVRAMIADNGRGAALWRRILSLPNSRFLMLGTPNLGSYEAVRWLTGRNPTQAKLSLLDFTQSADQIVDLVRRFPGLVELLPFDPDSPDFSRRALWTGLRPALGPDWKPADEVVLRQAGDTWAQLKRSAPDPKAMIYVAGCQDATVADYQLADYEAGYLVGRKRLDFIGTHEGDGTVTWKSGVMPGVPVWYVEDTAHDELCRQKRALHGYLDLLMTGTTTRLPAKPPGVARAAEGESTLFAMPSLPPSDDIPDEASVRSLGFGPGRPFAVDGNRPAMPVIQVSLRHGDLAYARHPVMVGHYLGDTIVSAEAALDERLDQALSRRLQLGIYPGPLKTHALFFNQKQAARPAGALVVGLGQVGELSPGLLEAGVCAALLDYALHLAQRPKRNGDREKGVRSAAVTSMLVGSGAGGMAVRDSIEALLRGAVAANRKLVDAELDDRVLIDRIEFLDLFEDVALDAADALEQALTDGQLAANVEWSDKVVEEGDGCRRRVRFDELTGWWHRLEIIEERGREGLRFIASTDRARAEETQATGQLLLADGFIRQASQSPRADAEVAKTLFEMLLPNRLKELAPKQADLLLLVDEVSARYPWELLENRWSQSGRPPAVAGGLVRQLKTPQYRPVPAHAVEAKAFVVGNPDLEGWEYFSDLPGARREAQKVAALLSSGGFQVRESIDEKADRVVTGLHEDAWRILHLAGHGEHELAVVDRGEDRPETCERCDQALPRREKVVSGMVIGRDTLLTPGDVEQMRWVPELVFINCCHLGKTQSNTAGKYTRLAANLAVQFIRMGVKAVVAAGWAVDDGAALVFAESFYTHLLDGRPFGEAVRAAREAVWVRFPNVNTWGAYQCYGDPAYRLRGDRPPGSGKGGKPFHAPVELVTELHNLAESVRMGSREPGQEGKAVERAHRRITELTLRIPMNRREAWLDRADVAAAIGLAWGETGDYAEAIEWLERAMKGDKGELPVRALEQYANFQVRHAGGQWPYVQAMEAEGSAEGQQAGADERRARLEDRRAELVERIEKALNALDFLCQRAPTVERLDLLGSACKRLALVCGEGPRRLEALVNMAGYYRQAYELREEADPYPFANWAVADLLVAQGERRQEDAGPPAWLDEYPRVIQQVRTREATDPDIWNSVALADLDLVLLLADPEPSDGRVTEATERVIEGYRAAFKRGASPREMASVREHLDFVIALGEKSPVGKVVRAIRGALWGANR